MRSRTEPMLSVDSNRSWGEAKPRAVGTDSWCPPLDDTVLRRRSVDLMAAAVSEVVSPLIRQQLEQLETSLMRLLCEHTTQLSSVQATLQSVEHMVVSRGTLRGSFKSATGLLENCSAAPSRAASRANSATKNRCEDGGQPATRSGSKGSGAHERRGPDLTQAAHSLSKFLADARSAEQQDRTLQRSPAPHIERRRSWQPGRRSSRPDVRNSSPNPQVFNDHMASQQSLGSSMSGNESSHSGQPRRHRRGSSPTGGSACTTFTVGTTQIGEHRISIHEPAGLLILPPGSDDSNPPNPSKDDSDDGKSGEQDEPSQGAPSKDPKNEICPTDLGAQERDCNVQNNYSEASSEELHVQLKVVVVSAQGLRNADTLPGQGVSDPYCICRLRGKPESEWKTPVVSDNLDPVWNCAQIMPDFHVGDALEFEIRDKDLFKQDDVLGWASIACSKFYPSGFKGVLPLRADNTDGRGGEGEVTLHIQFLDKDEVVAVTAEKLAGAAAALAVLPSQCSEASSEQGRVEVNLLRESNGKAREDSPQGSKSNFRRSNSEHTFQQNLLKQQRKVCNKAESPRSSDRRRKLMRRSLTAGDAFRARFATDPTSIPEDKEKEKDFSKAGSHPSEISCRRASSDRSSRSRSSSKTRSPDKYGDTDDRTSPHPPQHFDLYSLEQMHGARLLELEVEDGPSLPWSAVGSMLTRNERQESPEARYVRQQSMISTKVVPEAEEAAKSTSSRAFDFFGRTRTSGADKPENGDAVSTDLLKGSTRNLEKLRRDHDHRLTSLELHQDDRSNLVSPESSEVGASEEDRVVALQWKTRIALCICGVVPFQVSGRTSRGMVTASTWYQNMVLLVAVLSATCTIAQGLLGTDMVDGDNRNPQRRQEWSWYLGSLPFAVGSVIGLVIMRNGRVQKLVRSFPGPLEAYAYRHGFVDVWSHHASRRLLALVSFWAVVVLVRLFSDILLLQGIDYAAWNNLLLLVSFIISSSIFLALITVQLYIFSILGIMVEQFCFKFFDCPDVSQGIQEWNVIQAILRHVTSAFDTCFLATQTSALVALLLSATQLLQVDLSGGTRQAIGYIAGVFLPPVLMACAAGSLFFIAAEVTEKCSRVPALLNSVMCGGEDMLQHEKRHCIVQYVTYSAAGFYMKEVRLTASMALKLTYITALGAFFVMTKSAAGASTIF